MPDSRAKVLLASQLFFVEVDIFVVFFFSWGTERIPQRIQRYKRATLHWSTHPQRDQDETEKSSYRLDWLQKGIWYGPTKLDKSLPQNVQNIKWSHKLYRDNHENLKTAVGKNLAKEKIQRGIFQGYALSSLLFIIAMMPLNYILGNAQPDTN